MKKPWLRFELTNKQYWWGIGGVLLLAAVLRFYQLGQVPHGMTWDEAAIGYNGFAIFTTRRDEWLTRLPVSFWSFGDYKAPLAIYVNGLFTAVFGMTLWAVRVPFALSGVGVVLGMIYLTRVVFEQTTEKPGRIRFLSLVAGLLIALSPWHLHFSRIGFESGMALLFYIWGGYFFLKALTVGKQWRVTVDFLLSVMSFVASVYTYHSAKIAAPLFVFWLVIRYRRQAFKYWQNFGLVTVAGLLALRPLIADSFYGKGLERAGTLIVSQGYSVAKTIQIFLAQFATHFSASFLLLGETTTLRHGDGRWGVLLPTTLVLVLLAAVFGWRKKQLLQPFWFGIWLVLIGILPAALAIEVLHSNRALLALPGFLLLAIVGLRWLITNRWADEWKKMVIGGLVLLHGLFFVSYLYHYYTLFAAQSAADFQDGYLAAFRFALPYERGEEGKREVDKIIFTSDYGQPYIYALFVRQTNPIWYQGGSLAKYEFKDEVTIGDLERENTLVVASNQDDLLGAGTKADKVINGSDGSPRFRIYLPK